jgi:hypothetical protein
MIPDFIQILKTGKPVGVLEPVLADEENTPSAGVNAVTE